jgi:hypothetical protein
MSLLHHSTPLSAILSALLAAGTLVVGPIGLARAAQGADEEEPVDARPAATDEDDSSNGPGGQDKATKPDKAEPPPPAPGGWGTGGEEPEGKFRPQGKTGKLKDLEEQAEAEKKDEGLMDLGPAGFVNLDTAFLAQESAAEIVVPANDGLTRVFPTASFLIGAGYRVAKIWQLSLRFGVSTGKSDGPLEPVVEGARNPDQYTQIAVGGLEVGVKPFIPISRALSLPVGLALTMPIQEGDMFADANHRADIGKAIVNEAAAAARGWEDRALFVPKRFGITPSLGILFKSDLGPGKLTVDAGTRFDLLLRTAGNDPPKATGTETQGELNDLAITWLLGGGLFYRLFDGYLDPGLRLWLALATSTEKQGTADPGGTIFVFEPNLCTHVPFLSDGSFGLDARIAWTLPAGGEFGTKDLWGQRVSAGFFF